MDDNDGESDEMPKNGVWVSWGMTTDQLRHRFPFVQSTIPETLSEIRVALRDYFGGNLHQKLPRLARMCHDTIDTYAHVYLPQNCSEQQWKEAILQWIQRIRNAIKGWGNCNSWVRIGMDIRLSSICLTTQGYACTVEALFYRSVNDIPPSDP